MLKIALTLACVLTWGSVFAYSVPLNEVMSRSAAGADGLVEVEMADPSGDGERVVSRLRLPARAPSGESGKWTLPDLWPKDSADRLVAPQDGENDIWSKSGRLRLWFKNPNHAGILVAQLALLFFGAVLSRRHAALRIAASLLFLGAFVAMLITASRAALLVLGCGAAVMSVLRFRRRISVRVGLVAGAVLAVAVVAMMLSPMGARFGAGALVDPQRAQIWRAAPRMMADAPAGWGFGCSGRAFVEWYQQDSTFLVANLISSHLTLMAELGWCGRFAYVFLWLLLLGALFKPAKESGEATAFGLVLTLALSAFLHPSLSRAELFVLPVALAAVRLAASVRAGAKCGWAPVVRAASVALGVCFLVFAAGAVDVACPAIAGSRGRAVVNGRNPKVCVLDDDYALHGGFWWTLGPEIRRWYGARLTAEPLALVRDIGAVPRGTRHLVVVGERADAVLSDFPSVAARLPRLGRLTFISPNCPASDIVAKVPSRLDVRIVRGERAAALAGEAEGAPGVEVVPGAELYIPGWLDRLELSCFGGAR